jgi:hypothetical protein
LPINFSPFPREWSPHDVSFSDVFAAGPRNFMKILCHIIDWLADNGMNWCMNNSNLAFYLHDGRFIYDKEKIYSVEEIFTIYLIVYHKIPCRYIRYRLTDIMSVF